MQKRSNQNNDPNLHLPPTAVVVQNPTFAPSSTPHARTESVIVMGSNQQSYVVPMMVTGGSEEENGLIGNDAASSGSLLDDADYLVPSTGQATAYELMQVPGASDHRSSAQIYSPPEPPPPPPSGPTSTGAGGGDYTYIDEDAPDDGYSRADIEYATVVDGVQQQQLQLDQDGYVEGGALPSGLAVYAEPSARGSVGGVGAPAAGNVVLDGGGYVAGSDLPGLTTGPSVFETANSTA